MYWDWEPSILIGLIGVTIWYELSIRSLRRDPGTSVGLLLAKRIAFHSATFWVFIALISPIDSVADHSLFSVHMIQHMILIFVGPLLWVWGTPGRLVEMLLPFKPLRETFLWYTRPVPAFIVFTVVLWLWHVPSVYDAALHDEHLHILEHMLFMGTAIIGWWPVVGQYGPNRTPPVVLAYLAVSIFMCSGLAALITLVPHVLYPFYGSAPLAYGLSPLTDQQIGGTIMWLPGDLIYMGLIAGQFYRWSRDNPDGAPDIAEKAAARPTNPARV